MRAFAIYLGACTMPAGVLWLLDRAMRAWTGTTPWPARRHTTSEPVPAHPPVERMAVDLHYLADELRRLHSSSVPAKVHRMTAVAMAYDDLLRECCAALDVPVPAGRTLSGGTRLELEAELARAGLIW